MISIKNKKFNFKTRELLKNDVYGQHWPTVYLLNDTKSVYVGESTNLYNRMKNHLDNHEKNLLNQITIIKDDQFNKSATLDIEQELIRLFDADNNLELLNRNSGVSSNHNYYQREMYQNKIPFIWNELRKLNLAKSEYSLLINSEFFKYSPYIKLNEEQLEVSVNVLNDIMDSLENNTNISSVISGEAGTGKTVLALNLIFHLINNKNNYIDTVDFSDLDSMSSDLLAINRVRKYQEKIGRKLKVGFVVPMTSLRQTLNKVVNKVPELKGQGVVIGPSDVIKNDYDVIVVDEAHRLTGRRAITNYGGFDRVSRYLGLDPLKATQLEWIVKSSKTRVLFYDQNQMVKKSDVTANEFYNALSVTTLNDYKLTSQLRSLGGNDFINYTRKILNSEYLSYEDQFGQFDFKLFDNVDQMVNMIKFRNDEEGLSRVVAGYSWDWVSKNNNKLSTKQIIKKGYSDIKIGEHEYVWNRDNREFTLREESINEIGSIHTVQGYDLNYVGVIFGKEIDYNFDKKEITINRDKFKDTKVKERTTEEELKKFIINSYHVMMTRGIKGCYVYAYNKNFQKYLSYFIKKYRF